MWAPKHFSYRKLRRKRNQDGLRSTIIAALELPTRRIVGPPLVDQLFRFSQFSSVDQNQLLDQNVEAVGLEEETSEASIRPFAANIGRGFILPNTGLILTNSGEPVEESVGPRENGKNGVKKSLIRHTFLDGYDLVKAIISRDTKALRKESKSLDVICPLSYRYINYYHWMVDTLPRLRYATAYEKHTNQDITYIVWPNPPSYVYETLNMLGIPDDKIERAKSRVYYSANVIVPSYPAQTYADFQWIRAGILDKNHSTLNRISPGNNVYISREDAIERRTVNEPEVMEMLSNYGFESYKLENLSVKENSMLFESADIVVGAHGAGLTDLIYCDETTVVELFGSLVKPTYEELASIVDVNYEMLKCRPKSTDISVNIDELETIIQDISK